MPTPEHRVMGNMFGREDSIRSLRCIDPNALGCGRTITIEEYNTWDPLTQKEYRQSSWCKGCQDQIFGEPEGCHCEYVDVGVGWIPNPMNEYCPEHGDPNLFDHYHQFDYDPDLIEDPPPHDMHEIEWSIEYSL